MIKNIFTPVLLLVFFFQSCGTDIDPNVLDGGKFPNDKLVRVNTQINNSLDKATTNYEGSLSLSIEYQDNDAFTSKNVKWTYANSLWSPASEVKWKDGTTPARIYAFAPFVENLLDLRSVLFSVKTDQRGGLTESDLVGVINNQFVPAKDLNDNQQLDLIFTHRLSKIKVILALGTSFTADDVRVVKVNGVHPSVEFNAITSIISSATGTPSDLSMLRAGLLKYEAILPPQMFASGARFISVELEDGDIYTHTLEDGLNIEANKEYEITLRLSRDNTVLSSAIKINNWGESIDLGTGSLDNANNQPVRLNRTLNRSLFTVRNNTLRLLYPPVLNVYWGNINHWFSIGDEVSFGGVSLSGSIQAEAGLTIDNSGNVTGAVYPTLTDIAGIATVTYIENGVSASAGFDIILEGAGVRLHSDFELRSGVSAGERKHTFVKDNVLRYKFEEDGVASIAIPLTSLVEQAEDVEILDVLAGPNVTNPAFGQLYDLNSGIALSPGFFNITLSGEVDSKQPDFRKVVLSTSVKVPSYGDFFIKIQKNDEILYRILRLTVNESVI